MSKTEAEPLRWPKALIGLVPRPALCEIDSILSTRPDSYLISCSCSVDDVLTGYLDLLESLGFEETLKMTDPDGTILSVSMEKEQLKVDLMNSGMDPHFLIKVKLTQP
jgi:hypothetical protein